MARVFNLGEVYRTGEEIKRARRLNALADIDLDRERQFNSLGQDATPEQYARVGRSDVANALINTQRAGRESAQFTQEQKINNTRLLNAAAAEVAQNPAAVSRWLPELQAAGMNVDVSSLSPEQLQQAAAQLYESTSAALAALGGGQREAGPLEQVVGPDGQPVFASRAEAIGQRPYIKPDKPEAPRASYRTLTPAEIQAAGLPPGSSAQLDEASGKIDVLSKRDTTGGLSQKDQTTAKLKLNTVRLARQQLANIRKKYIEGTKGVNAFGPFGVGRLPTEKGKAFDKAVDIMRSTLTALTRVPGVGAMSDYETRLDQAKFPSRTDYESVTDDNITQLDNMLTAIESGYRTLLEGGEIQPSEAAQSGQKSFATEAEASAAAQRGEIKPGDRITVGGVSGTWQ